MNTKNLPIRYNGLENAKNRSRSNMLDMLTDSNYGAHNSSDHLSESAIQFDDILLTSITPRSINQYTQSRIERLANSIRSTGNRLINPITVVRAKDLPHDGEVMKKFIAKGVDVDSLEYVIVAGERRFRAFKLLYDQEEAKEHDIYFSNPFATITANILTAQEAENEKLFYEQSNTEARQLGPEEVMRLFESALNEVDTDEKKRDMLLEMRDKGVAIKKEIPDDSKEAARMFRKDQYCVYYLENELGISGWSEGTAKRYITVVNGCCDEVKQAIYDCTYPIKEAKLITKYPFEVQRKFLQLWLDGDKEAYQRLLVNDGREKAVKVKHYTHKTAGRQLRATLTLLDKEKRNIEEFEKNLGGEDRKLMKKALEECDNFTLKINRIIEMLES